MALFLLFLYFVSVAVAWRWEYADRTETRCSKCDTAVNRLCSTNFRDVLTNRTCIIFNPERKPTNIEEVIRFLGDNAVIVFVGDSNARNMFRATLSYFGRESWLTNLTSSARHWKDQDTRRTVDHTYLCPQSFPGDYTR